MITITNFPDYAVTEDGQIWSKKSQRFLKPYLKNTGYLAVVLYNNGISKEQLIHRLVAESYLPNINNLPFVNHKDEIKTNNCVSNLEWCTPKYNISYSANKKGQTSSHAGRPIMCIETNIIYNSVREAEHQTGIDHSGIHKVCTGKRITAGGYHWKFI